MDKIIYLFIYFYSIAVCFLSAPLNFISSEISRISIGQALIYGVSVFCLINRLKNRKPCYVLLSIILGIVTINLFAFDLFYMTKIVFGATIGYILTKIKTTKNRIIGAVILFIVFILYHFIVEKYIYSNI